MNSLEGARKFAAIGTYRKLWILVPESQRRRAWAVVASLFFGTVLELLGIGLLVPLVNLLTHDSVSPNDSILFPVFSVFGAQTKIEMLTVGFLTVAIVVLVKNLYLFASSYFLFSEISKIRESIEARMFKKYLHAEYSFHLQSNSAELSRNIVSETDHIVTHAFIPGLTMAVEGLTVIGITFLLFYVEPVSMASLIAFFTICGVTYTRGISKAVEKFGSQRVFIRKDVFRIVVESLSGIKHIKSLNREEFFIQRFNHFSEKYARLSARTESVQRVPAYLVEIWGVVGLLVVVFSMLLQGRDTESVVTVMGLFVGASFRFVPGFNRILISVQTLKLAKPAIDGIFSEVGVVEDSVGHKKEVRIRNQVEFCDVGFTYSNSHQPTLSNISFSIVSGSTVGVIGTSGAGKTTLVDLLLGLLSPTCGEVLIDGKVIDTKTSNWRSRVGYVAQDYFLIDDTIENNIKFGMQDHDYADAQLIKCIEIAQLAELVKFLPEGVRTMVGERGTSLSGGQRQRIAIARALYHEPELLVLDEATSALDPETELKFIESLRSQLKNVTLIIVSHRFSSLKYCDRIFRVENHRVVENKST